MKSTSSLLTFALASLLVLTLPTGCSRKVSPGKKSLAASFLNPPDSVRPGVYWYFMDGNLSREAMTGDLEAMKEAGIGSVIFLEVNMGLPRGNVDMMSEEWIGLFAHARSEAERLGITIKLGIGPGWAGSGGPWVKPEQSMQHLVSSFTQIDGARKVRTSLPRPKPMTPLFGEGSLTPEFRALWENFYLDVAVLAFPAPAVPSFIPDFTKKPGREIYGGLNAIKSHIADFEEKTLYYRPAFSSYPNVKPFLPAPPDLKSIPDSVTIPLEGIIDLSEFMKPDGTLEWDAPKGKWIVMRFGAVNNGNLTRPAPVPGLGFECDKFDTTALNAHFDSFVRKLLPETVVEYDKKTGGITTLHMDSWEMGSANWTGNFREEFKKRRGYDPQPYYPTYSGIIVGSLERSERFLWDMRLTSQDLVIENHAGHVKTIARRNGLRLSIEPYDINPTADLDLGAVADIPMCEFWLNNYGFNSAFSCLEATSIAHVLGRPVVAAESFTSCGTGFISWPGSLKNQGDWAFCTGINNFYYHTFSHKPFGDQYRPGMTMGSCGIHWDRGQTFWPMVGAYHTYISRCSHILQQGRTIASILYLTPEGAPHVFRPPLSATVGEPMMPDRKGYNFDGCSPNMLMGARTEGNKVVFESGATYDLLVLPGFETMTPGLLEKIASLVEAGARITGIPPLKSPSLVNFPECDAEVGSLAKKLWGSMEIPENQSEIKYGKGSVYWGGELSRYDAAGLYPTWESTATLLKELGVHMDFEGDASLRFTHRQTAGLDIYFVSNKTDGRVSTECTFNTLAGAPELWDPVSGSTRKLTTFRAVDGRTTIPLEFESWQSYFIIFDRTATGKTENSAPNFGALEQVQEITGPWKVTFDPKWGGPGTVTFNQLEDWTTRPEEGIRYYSGIAVYSRNIDLKKSGAGKYYLNIGEVNRIARVRLNGRDLGVVWCAPWQVDITDALKDGPNSLEIDVANLWVNRLVGDEKLPDDGIRDGKFPDWLLKGEPRPSGRYTFCAERFYSAESPLSASGLVGPVTVQRQ